MLLLLTLLSQNDMQLQGRAGLDLLVPMQWSFYQEGEDKAMVSGPLMGANGVLRSGPLGAKIAFFTGSYDHMSIQSDDSTTDLDSGTASRVDFQLEARYFVNDFYFGFNYGHHSERWQIPVIWPLDQQHDLNSFGLGLGFDFPGKKATLTPVLNASASFFNGVRTTKWGSITDDVSGTGLALFGTLGAVYHYKPLFLSGGITGQALAGRFGDDEKASHSNFWALHFGIGGEF